ncbi:hypothetical protein MYSI104531_27360 [Mycobacterium simiae]
MVVDVFITHATRGSQRRRIVVGQRIVGVKVRFILVAGTDVVRCLGWIKADRPRLRGVCRAQVVIVVGIRPVRLVEAASGGKVRIVGWIQRRKP